MDGGGKSAEEWTARDQAEQAARDRRRKVAGRQLTVTVGSVRSAGSHDRKTFDQPFGRAKFPSQFAFASKRQV